MANTYSTLTELFTDIANKIRIKKNSTETIIADNFPTEIEALRSGFDYSNQEVTMIPDYAFYGNEDLNSVDCYNLTTIGTSAFENCKKLKTIILYDGVENVGENAFKGCDNTIIYCMFDSQPETWHENWNIDNCEVEWLGGVVETWDISATEEDSVTAKLYNNMYNEGMYSLIIDGSGNMKDYFPTSSPWYEYREHINSFIILRGITSIGNMAFYDCKSLTSITIPDSVTSIGKEAFYNCESLTSITIPDSVTRIDEYAFFRCISFTSINIPDSVTSIGNGVFRNCESLTTINIPDSVTRIDESAFYYCSSLTTINIPDSVTRIGDSVFNNCTSLTTINIPDGVTSIGDWAFYHCISLTTINLPDSVTRIGNQAFSNCTSLTTINIPDSVTRIGNQAFSNCTSLTTINIPDSVTSIGNKAFYTCFNLTSIVYTGTIAQWQAIIFGDSWNDYAHDCIIHCTDGDIAKDGTITYH